MVNQEKEQPLEDQMNDALAHYEEASASINHYNNSIPKAIKEYYLQKSVDREKFKWVIDQWGDTTNRYIEAERLLLELNNMPWFQLMFSGRKILSFLKSRKDKYDF